MARAVAGYTFPNMPGAWSASEKQFGLALRSLFDMIFIDQKTQDRNTAVNTSELKELGEKFIAETQAIAEQLARIKDTIADLEERVGDLERN